MRACLVLLLVAYSASADTCSNTHKDEASCATAQGCVWCKSKAVPSSCLTTAHARGLPKSVFFCNSDPHHPAAAAAAAPRFPPVASAPALAKPDAHDVAANEGINEAIRCKAPERRSRGVRRGTRGVGTWYRYACRPCHRVYSRCVCAQPTLPLPFTSSLQPNTPNTPAATFQHTVLTFLSLLTRCSSYRFCAPQDTLAGSPSNTAATVEGLKYLRAPGGN